MALEGRELPRGTVQVEQGQPVFLLMGSVPALAQRLEQTLLSARIVTVGKPNGRFLHFGVLRHLLHVKREEMGGRENRVGAVELTLGGGRHQTGAGGRWRWRSRRLGHQFAFLGR